MQKKYKIKNKYLIIWITGQSGSGKTTIAKIINQKLGGIILDGDEMRKSISYEFGFNKKDREKHNLRVARLAKILSQYTNIIIAMIAPFESIRKQINKIIKPIWIYVERNIKTNKEKPYEIPKKYHIKVNSNKQTSKEQIKSILKYLKSQKNK